MSIELHHVVFGALAILAGVFAFIADTRHINRKRKERTP